MAEKKAYIFKLSVFGLPKSLGGPAVRLDINDIFTDIHKLDVKKSDATGRIHDLRSTTGHDPTFVHVFENDKTKRVVHGIICSIKSSNLPDQFDWTTGGISPLKISEDLLEKSHFMIDTSTGMLAFQKGKSSPHTGSLAAYITEKLKGKVVSVSIDIHMRKDISKKLEEEDKKGNIKLLEIRIKRTALGRVDLLGPETAEALKSLSKISDAESIGIIIGLEKYKRSGGFSVTEAIQNIKRFLGMQISDKPMSDVETALIKADDEMINLLKNKLSIDFEIPSSIMSSRSVDSEAVVKIMEQEFNKRKSDF